MHAKTNENRKYRRFWHRITRLCPWKRLPLSMPNRSQCWKPSVTYRRDSHGTIGTTCHQRSEGFTCIRRCKFNHKVQCDGRQRKDEVTADYVSLGRTMDGCSALGSSTENSAFQLTRNPWNLDCVPVIRPAVRLPLSLRAKRSGPQFGYGRDRPSKQPASTLRCRRPQTDFIRPHFPV